MAVTAQGQWTSLPCGARAEALWAHAVAGERDTHESGCPHCLSVGAAFATLAEATELMRGPDQGPPPALAARVMAAVRAAPAPAPPAERTPAEGPEPRPKPRPGPSKPAAGKAAASPAEAARESDQGEGGRPAPRAAAELDEAALPEALTQAVATLGVRVVSCSVEAPHGRPGRVRLEIAAPYGADLPRLATRARQRVEVVARARGGRDLRAVDVRVVDLDGTPAAG